MYQRILVPLDGSDTAHLALDSALALARTMGARLRLLHVVEKLAFAAGLDPPARSPEPQPATPPSRMTPISASV
jgi:nucleotide-binding universal stress UspA family protein